MAEKRGFGGWKWIMAIVLLGAAGGGVWWFWWRDSDTTTEYQTTAVVRGELIQTVTATGTLNPVLNVQVGSQISGIILKLNADFNSPVKAGDVIAQLDPATYRANVHSAEGDLANARAGLEFAQLDARRAEELQKNNLISQSEYDRTVANLHQAEAQVKIKEAALERSNVDLARCTIYAPVDGIVISRNVDVGQTVAASLSAPVLFQIANDLTKMQIDANVAEADVGGVEEGQQVDFTVDAFPSRTFRGKVIQVRNAPISVQNVVTYDTVIEVSNPDLKLKPGMTANVSIIVARRENTLKIANAALRFRPPESMAESKTNVSARAQSAVGGQPGGGRRSGEGGRGGGGGRGGRSRGERQMVRTIYVLSDNSPDAKLKPVQIKTGITDGVMTEITEGLKEDDNVVTSVIQPKANVTAPAANPFGGGMPGMRRF